MAKNTEVKATNLKMVPEIEAKERLCEFAGKVIAGNRVTRRMVCDYLDILDDPEMEPIILKALVIIVLEDEKGRENYVKLNADSEPMMQLYDLAMDVREALGLTEFDAED